MISKSNTVDFVCFTISVGPPVPLQYSNYDEQVYDQLLTLFELVSDIDVPIVMGDFHQGPASRSGNIAYIRPFHYGLMTAQGFVSPYVLLDGRCTICLDNPAVNARRSSNELIDHIFILADSYKGRVLSSEVIVHRNDGIYVLISLAISFIAYP